MTIEAMKQALEALESLARYENPETRVQVRKPKDGGPIVTMYPHKVATDAANTLRTAIEQAEKQEPVAFNAGVPLLYPEMKDGETISVEYTTPPAAQPAPVQEPVAYPDSYVVGPCICGSWPGGKCLKCPRIPPQPQREWVDVECPLCGEMAVAHTHPVLNKRKWVGLTDEEIGDFASGYRSGRIGSFVELTESIETKIKDKNT